MKMLTHSFFNIILSWKCLKIRPKVLEADLVNDIGQYRVQVSNKYGQKGLLHETVLSQFLFIEGVGLGLE